jgi:hypothetical protein
MVVVSVFCRGNEAAAVYLAETKRLQNVAEIAPEASPSLLPYIYMKYDRTYV